MIHTLPNGPDQFVRFDGELLGTDNSKEFAASQGRRRWHEVNIFKTIDGRYVVQKVGRSDLPGETERSTVHVSDTAQGAYESLHGSDADGVSFMTYVARTALRQAMSRDEALVEAYSVRDLTA